MQASVFWLTGRLFPHFLHEGGARILSLDLDFFRRAPRIRQSPVGVTPEECKKFASKSSSGVFVHSTMLGPAVDLVHASVYGYGFFP